MEVEQKNGDFDIYSFYHVLGGPSSIWEVKSLGKFPFSFDNGVGEDTFQRQSEEKRFIYCGLVLYVPV